MQKKKAESWLSASIHKEFKSKTKKAGTTMARVMREAAKDFNKKHTKKRRPKQAA
jgi:hypothetical protein